MRVRNTPIFFNFTLNWKSRDFTAVILSLAYFCIFHENFVYALGASNSRGTQLRITHSF